MQSNGVSFTVKSSASAKIHPAVGASQRLASALCPAHPMLRRRSYISQMLFSFLIASVSAGPTNTTGIGPSPSTMPIDITNRCGVDGAMDHKFVVTLKPPPANSNGRRLDTTEDKLSFLQGWVHQYDPEDASNGATRRKANSNEANSNSIHVSHLFTVTQLAVAVSASDDVRHTQHVPIFSTSASHLYTSLTSHGPTCMHQTIARMAKDPAVSSIEVDNIPHPN